MSALKRRAAVLVFNYFEQSEFEKPIKALKEGGIDVAVIAADKKELQAMKGKEFGDKFEADLLLEDARSEDYEALVLPGGVVNSDYLRMNEKAKAWAVEFLEKGKLVAAICHAPWLLVSADLVEERRLTSYFTLQDDIRNAGGEWVNREVVDDKNLITSRKPDDLTSFNGAILKWIKMKQAKIGHF